MTGNFSNSTPPEQSTPSEVIIVATTKSPSPQGFALTAGGGLSPGIQSGIYGIPTSNGVTMSGYYTGDNYFTTGQIIFSNSNNISFGLGKGQTINNNPIPPIQTGELPPGTYTLQGSDLGKYSFIIKATD